MYEKSGFTKMVHYFTVDVDSEREALEGAEYVEKKLSEREKLVIEETSLAFEKKLRRWLATRENLFAEFAGGMFFGRAFYPDSFHSFFDYTHFDLIRTNIERECLYDMLREYVRELSRKIPSRWWKFDYIVFFKEGKSYVRNIQTWEFREVDVPVPEEVEDFLSM